MSAPGLIKMKNSIIICLFFLSSCCGETPEEKFKRECPYTLSIPSALHFLKVPIKVIPNKLYYKVGDTITFSSIYSDSIYDLNTNHIFKIPHFPFKPVISLHRFYDGFNFKVGFDKNPALIDPRFTSVYKTAILSHTNYFYFVKFKTHVT